MICFQERISNEKSSIDRMVRSVDVILEVPYTPPGPAPPPPTSYPQSYSSTLPVQSSAITSVIMSGSAIVCSPSTPVISVSKYSPGRRITTQELNTSDPGLWDSHQSPLHQLAAVAERKQEEVLY